ncbi:hypothetical protein L6452_09004 [Arctium lappa]|uniref:Uncharacterized protein n=1 Tax=Arctium lappa TaxID=4217 RepID=A0ACB9DJA3_ARCLA|nr:hypothetical protein L6452_09004 [Arctium lappa]
MGVVLQWLINLRPKSIDSFAELVNQFFQQFASSRKMEKQTSDLYYITQKAGESVRNYFNRFNFDMINVRNCDVRTAIEAYKRGLNDSSDLYMDLIKYPPENFEDVRARMLASMQVEDDATFRHKHSSDKKALSVKKPFKTKSTSKGTSKEVVEDLINVQTNVKWPPKIKRDNAKKDKSKWCDFHGDHGHITDHCIALRRELAWLTGGSNICGLTYSTSKRHASRGPEDFPISRSSRLKHELELEAMPITFDQEDLDEQWQKHHDDLIIQLMIGNCLTKRILVDGGSSANIIFLSTVFDGVVLDQDNPDRVVFIGTSLDPSLKESLISFLQDNADCFARTQEDMVGIDPEGDKLLNTGKIQEVKYPEWLANVVVVQKKNGKWRVCINFTYLNKPCPKDPFPLPHIDVMVDTTTGHELLMFMDTYLDYNQILMHRGDQEKTTFMTDKGVYCYKVMPFGLKNAGLTYQWLVNKIFKERLGDTMEVYINDMLVKSKRVIDHIGHLKQSFDILKEYHMKLNPMKCSFGKSVELGESVKEEPHIEYGYSAIINGTESMAVPAIVPCSCDICHNSNDDYQVLDEEFNYESNGSFQSKIRAKTKKLWPKQCSVLDVLVIKSSKLQIKNRRIRICGMCEIRRIRMCVLRILQNSMTSREALAIGTDVKPPVLIKGEYEQWKDRFMDFIDRNDLGDYIRISLKEGIMKTPTKTHTVVGENGEEEQSEYPLPLEEYTDEQRRRHKVDRLDRTFILQGIPNEIYVKIDSYNSMGKQMWDQLEKMMLGSKIGNQLKVSKCLNKYEEFKAKKGESFETTYDRFVTLLNELSKNKVRKSQIELNVKFFSILQPEWKRQNDEEVEKIKEEKKKVVEVVADPIALVVKKKSVSLKKKKKAVVSESEEVDSDDNSDSDDCENLKQAMLMLTKAFLKKLYKKPGSNSQRYSSGSQNYEHKERIEGKRIEEKRLEEKRYRTEEKKESELTKCYNYGKLGHFAKDCRKPKVRNSEYYKNKMLLAKQQEAGKALMAEYKYWLDHSDEEEEKEEKAHLCFMGKTVTKDEVDSDCVENEQVCDMSESDFLNEMHVMMIKLQELYSKLKRERGVIKEKKQSILKLSNDIAEKNVLIDALHKNIDTSAKEKTIINNEISETTSKYKLCQFESKEVAKKCSFISKENKYLTDKVNVLEEKLYTLGQTEQTIHLNKPKKSSECWGLGYENPHYLKKGISKVPVLYDFENLKLAPQYPEIKVKWTKLSEEDEAKEKEKRKNTTKMQLPFCYEKLNYSYSSDKSKFLSNDYFESYSSKELESKSIEGKVYVHPLVLESKISELENALAEERILIHLEQIVFSTMLKNSVISKNSKASKSNDISDLLDEEFDFLNSEGDLDDCVGQFDFNAKLPDHSQFIINSFGLPSVYEKGETSTKFDEPVSVNTTNARGKKKKSRHSQKQKTTGKPKKKKSFKSHSSNSKFSKFSDVRKRKYGVKSEWLPKKKIDENAKSYSDSDCNRGIDSITDVNENVAFQKPKLVTSYKRYSIKQLFQLSPSARKSSNYKRNDYASRQYSDVWFGTYDTRHMWYLDSGCSKHMTGHKDLLSNYIENIAEQFDLGMISFHLFWGYSDVIQDNVTITKAKRCSMRTEDGKELLVGKRKSNLFTINLSKVQTDNELVKGLPELEYVKEHLCVACEKGKMKRVAHKLKPEPSTSSSLELLHMDICGPVRTQSINGKKYVLVIVDDYSRYTWVKFLRSKDEMPEVIITFLKITQVNLQKLVKFLRTDNDTKFKNKIVEDYLELVEITHQYSAARTPEQNGVVKRRNRTLVKTTRTMLSQSDLPLCFVLNDKEKLNKFSLKSDEGIFIGYSQTSAAYRVYLKKSKIVVESVNVTFDEELASAQDSSEPVITGVLASGQISPEPVPFVNKSDEVSSSNSHLSDLDLLFELFYDEFLGTKVSKSSVVDRSEDSRRNQPTTSNISTESNSPIQQKIPIQTHTPKVEVVNNHDEPEVTESVGCTVTTSQQPDNVVPTKASAHNTSTVPLSNTEQTHEANSGFLDENHEHMWTKEHPISQIIGDPYKPVETRYATLNMYIHDSFLSKVESTRVSKALADSD